ncbi:MAG: hypothetical protein KGP35_02490 [Bacteroidetes bacterium]|nr:hypothetical protein [Bacteroidota bacterium]
MIQNISTYTLKTILTIFVLSVFVQLASSSSLTSGKTKKKTAAKSNVSHSLYHKSANFSLHDGFKLKGVFSTYKENTAHVTFRMQSAYFEKGNSIYVMPLKQKVILSKFKTPEKSIY